MPWKCPACSTHIRQQLTAAGDEAPRHGVIYRCGVCRMELVRDPQLPQMVPAPMPGETEDEHASSRH